MRLFKVKSVGVDRYEDDRGVVYNEEDLLDLLLKFRKEADEEAKASGYRNRGAQKMLQITSLSGKVDLTIDTLVRMLGDMEGILTDDETRALHELIEDTQKRIMLGLELRKTPKVGDA